jgi:hypothetical protein
MRTYHVYTAAASPAYLGTVAAQSLADAQSAVERALIIPCVVRDTPPPPPTLEHRVGSDGRLYRH